MAIRTRQNQKLSVQHARVVAEELVKDGVPESAIEIMPPLAPTGPGVREPQNRRAEIIIKSDRQPTVRLAARRYADHEPLVVRAVTLVVDVEVTPVFGG
jgi:hypothetical protein